MVRPLQTTPPPPPKFLWPRPHPGPDRLGYDSKCDYVKIFESRFPRQRLISADSAGATAVLGTAWFTWLGLFLDRSAGVLPDPESAPRSCFSLTNVFRK